MNTEQQTKSKERHPDFHDPIIRQNPLTRWGLMSKPKFDHYEIRMASEDGGFVDSHPEKASYEEAVMQGHKTFASIYGVASGISTHIGDFRDFAAATYILEGMIGPKQAIKPNHLGPWYFAYGGLSEISKLPAEEQEALSDDFSGQLGYVDELLSLGEQFERVFCQQELLLDDPWAYMMEWMGAAFIRDQKSDLGTSLSDEEVLQIILASAPKQEGH